MIGGFYVVAIEQAKSNDPPKREFIGLIAGPFATWAEADAIGPRAVKHVNEIYKDAEGLQFGICEFWFTRLVLGTRNGPLWAKPTPVMR